MATATAQVERDHRGGNHLAEPLVATAISAQSVAAAVGADAWQATIAAWRPAFGRR